MLVVAVVGFVILVVLAVLIGRSADRRAQEGAWRRIASARRLNAEREQALDEREAELTGREDSLSRARRVDALRAPVLGVVGSPDTAA